VAEGWHGFHSIPLRLNPKPFTVATFNINTCRAIDITAIYESTTCIFDNFFVHISKMNIKLSHPMSDNYFYYRYLRKLQPRNNPIVSIYVNE
jgi:hypothetical protein